LLARSGRRADALASFRRGLPSAPDAIDRLRAEIVDAMLAADLTLAGELAAILAAVQRGSRWYPGAGAPPPGFVDAYLSVSKLKHDRDQLAYLRERDIVGAELEVFIERFGQAIDRLRSSGIDDDARIEFGDDDRQRLGDVYGRIVNVARASRVGGALSSAWNRTNVTRLYRRGRPGIVVIDDFLSSEALASLRRFAVESTVWSSNRYANGRLGAFFFAGFNCPLLLQIAEELRDQLPDLIGPRYPLRQLWGFKNTRALPADSTIHADFAAINVNFWITATEANLDPASGGMVIYDIDAPPSWDFITYNERIDTIREYLAAQRPGVIRVPYRENRAIIFNSDLFHATEAVRFRPDFEHHRVNVTMLYGERHADGHYPPRAISSVVARPAWRSTAFQMRRNRA
jgi:hypothetical protein